MAAAVSASPLVRHSSDRSPEETIRLLRLERINGGMAQMRDRYSSNNTSNGNIGQVSDPFIGSPTYDELTVFLAAPLVWKDDNSGELHPIEKLDFDREREILTDSVKSADVIGARIVPVFETATADRLGEILATSNSRVLHFSCHGCPNNLCFEDGSGGVHLLRVDELRGLLSVGGNRLRSVFVSACHSRAAGQAFVDAGVRHVVCCQQDEKIMDVATLDFTRRYYSALSSGQTVLKSFQSALQAVKSSAQVPPESAASEAEKYLLLPEGADHDVPVFYTMSQHRLNRSRSAGNADSWILPRPPDLFVGREMEMYETLRSLDQCRLVKLTGPVGIGKRSLAAAVCRYINDRRRTFPFEEAVWLPLMHSPRTDDLYESLRRIFDMLLEQGPDAEFRPRSDYARACGTIIESLHLTKVLFVIDAKEFQEAQALDKLSTFLGDLFNGIRDLKTILVTRPGFEKSFDGSCVEHTEVALHPLGFKDTAMLFGMKCPFVKEGNHPDVRTSRQLSRLLVSEGKENLQACSKVISKRNVDIFRIIGDGIPAQIHKSARELMQTGYDELIRIGEREEPEAYPNTRFELEQQLLTLEEEKKKAASAKKFKEAQELKEKHNELMRLRDSLPDLADMREELQSLTNRLEHAVSQEDYGTADKLNYDISLVKGKIMQEERAQSDAGLMPIMSCAAKATKSKKGLPVRKKIKKPGKKPFSIVISRGSIVSFKYPRNPGKSAIVNSTNEICVGVSGADGAIAKAGGPSLKQDRESLPSLGCRSDGKDIRCPTGEAKITGPGVYGSLHVPFVIHATGPNYNAVSSVKEGDKLLRSAYTESLERAKEHKLEVVAFSLISTGVFRGGQRLEKVLRIGLKAICNFAGYDELREVHLCAFESAQCDSLINVSRKLGLLK